MYLLSSLDRYKISLIFWRRNIKNYEKLRNESESCQAIYSAFKGECKNIFLFFGLFRASLNKDIYEHYENLVFRIEKTTHCIDKIFENWPPEQSMVIIDKEDKKKILEATIAFEAFILNCNAIFDSIAHIWNNLGLESKYQKQALGIIPNEHKKRKEFIDSLPDQFKDFLKKKEIKKAMKFVADIRDHLVHRYSPRIIEIDTHFIVGKNRGCDEEKLRWIALEYRGGYYSELLKDKKPECLIEKYDDYFRVRPIFEVKDIKSSDVLRYRSCFKHEYIHAFMLEAQQLIILLSSNFLMSCVDHLEIPETERESIQFFKNKIKTFLIDPRK